MISLVICFFHPNEQELVTQERALNIFKPDESGGYTITVKQSRAFIHTIDCIVGGLSFRQVEVITSSQKKRFKSSEQSIVSDTEASNIARTVCAVNLQALASLLNDDSIWAFSLANDASPHRGKSNFDNRIRFYFHTVRSTTFTQSLSQCFLDIPPKICSASSPDFLDILCPSWRTKLIGLGSDGANVMTGEYNGVLLCLNSKFNIKFIESGALSINSIL